MPYSKLPPTLVLYTSCRASINISHVFIEPHHIHLLAFQNPDWRLVLEARAGVFIYLHHTCIGVTRRRA